MNPQERDAFFAVSLFTREWIEISASGANPSTMAVSPSLRGSGLKSLPVLDRLFSFSLPLYEGVD